MTIDERHDDVALHLGEFHRLNDPLQKRWRFTLARPHIPDLRRERDDTGRRIDETVAQLEAWDARITAETVEPDKQRRREDDWIALLDKLVELYRRRDCALASLEAIGQMLMPPMERTR